MDGWEIREAFLRFFEERGHRRVPSASLIPPPESGLLLSNAGMNQFIPYFLGHAPAPFDRAASVQKCFRTNDIDNVGRTARHLTFFEMLGNFSFGDYFKRESCAWGFELVTEVFGIDPDRLWVTVFETDDEAADVWRDIGIPAERIVRRGRADNYWWTHAAGPAGPCSEIFVDRGPRYGREGGPEVDEDRYMEIWNHVFMQDEVDEREQIRAELPEKNIDTGSSLERVATVLQDKATIFETDIFAPLFEVAESLAGTRQGAGERSDVSLRVIADHGRATTFLIADGVLPSNEGRGYVLRRMLRRVVSHARRLGVERPVMEELAECTIRSFGSVYPELEENRAYILQVAASEEERFGGTLRQGMVLFEDAVARASGTLPGDVVFKLHDTFGFPKELTRELVEDAGLAIDLAGFEERMAEQRERAQRAARKGRADEDVAAVAASVGATEFVGYEHLAADARLLALLGDAGPLEVAGEGTEVRLVLDRTPFYAEGGGQVGDAGYVRTPGGLLRVLDTKPGPGGASVHTAVVQSGEVRTGEEVRAEVDEVRRVATARAHTATHVVHWTLKRLLGEHARQAGSLITPGRLRFDFPHHSAVPADVLAEAEEVANERLAENGLVTIYETTFDEAKAQGATALFGEKYGEFVRVVEVGDFSIELCGGTHVPRAGSVTLIRILGEGSIGAGMRRVEALVGPDALRELRDERALLDALVAAAGGGDPRTAPDRVRALVDRVKRLESELGRIGREARRGRSEAIVAAAAPVAGVPLVVAREDASAEDLRELAQDVVGRLGGANGAAVVLGSAEGGRPLLVAACSHELVARGVTAPALLERAARAIGGGAGGKPILGMAGGRDAGALPAALGTIAGRLEELLAGRA
ncbi:MAG: alanine--tRNA ligase [Actinomycetota bacterium]